MNFKKVVFSLLLALTLIFDAISPFQSLFQPILNVDAAQYYDNVMVYAGEDIPVSMLNYNGDKIWPSAYIIADGVKYPAYCVDPMLYGADLHPNQQYPININGTNFNAKVSTVLHNSVPYTTKEDILERFPGLTDLQIYAATKAAIRSVAEQSASSYPNDNLWDGDPQTVAFAKYLINLARTATEDAPKAAIFGISGMSDLLEDDDYYYRTVTVQSTNYPLVEGTKINLTIPSDAPAGTVITYEDDTPIPSDGVENKTLIKIKVPKSSIPENTSGTFNIIADMSIVSQVILFGVPVDSSDIGSYQRYEVSMPNQPAVFDIPMSYISEPKEKEPEFGGVKILKYDNITGNLIAGAIFEVKGIDDNNKTILFQVQASAGASVPAVDNEAIVTVGNGTVDIAGIPVGKYYISEISAPPHYDKSPDGIYSQVVEVQSSEIATVYPQVMFRNNPFGKLKVTKIDAVTGLPVAGATLRIRNEIAGIDITRTTDSSGVINLEDIPQGNYSITEVNAGSDYEKNPTTVVVPVRWGELSEATFDNQPHTSFEVTKINSKTNQPVSGAVFTLKELSTSKEWTLTTLAGGKAVVNNIPAGNYTLKEIFVPEPLILNSTVINIQIDNDKINTYTAVNDEKPTVTLEKYDEKTSQLIGGAEFRLEKLDGAWQTEFMVDSTGTKTLTVTPGTYRFTEIAAPYGYMIVTEHKDFVLNPNDEITIKFDNRLRPALEILKIDEATKLPLAGAKFRVTNTEGGTVGEYTTNASGLIRINNLTDEIYTVEEIVAPDGYLLETQHKDVKLVWGETTQLIFTNKARPKLEIKKIDTITGEPLAGARFKLIKTEDLTVSEYITDSSGTILIENLDETIYTVEEIIAPEGYILNPQHKEIQLEWGKTKTLIYEDIRKPTFILTKTNALTFAPIPDTTYKVEYEDANGGIRTLGTYRTNENGQIILPKVDAGWYIITETIPAPGFSLSANPVTRKYLAPGENAYTTNSNANGAGGDTSGTNIQVLSGSDFLLGHEILNYPLNSIVIRKAHYVTGELLAGAVFEVRRVTEETSGSSGTVIGRYTTDNSGIIVLTGLEPGGYIVEEIKAPNNFLISENSQQQLWLKYDGTTIAEVTFANIPYGSILITKTDAQTGEPLANARFRVTDGSGAVAGNANGEFTTDENGEALVANLKPGSYVITEIEAPENYFVDTTPQTVNVGIDGKTYKVSFKNQPSGTLVIRKLDSVTKEPLADAEFKVTTSGSDVVGTSNGIFKTDVTGTITIPHLPKGTYIVQEIKAPTDYILENQSQTIAIDYGKTYTLDFYNKHMSGLQIIKIDSVTKQPLKGAEFAVYKQSGELFGRYTTDADGVIIVDTLEPGWYKAVETKTLTSYLLDETPKDFEITANQFVKRVFENAPMSTLIIRKVDADTRQPLKGAEFTVKTMSGALIGNYVSDEDGLVTVPALMPGWYTVTETVAPVGYSLGDNVQNVEITNSKTVTVEFRNLPFGSLVIKKIDEFSGVPIAGAQFSVSHQNGAFMGEYVTGNDGTIAIPDVEPGWYIVSENRAPSGYQLDNTAKTVEVKPVVPTVTTFTNKPLTAIEIVKVDSVTRLPLSDTTFKVERPNGEVVGTYKTDVSGKALVSGLSEGTYIVSETVAPDGYHLNETPKTVVVTSNKVTVVEFANKPFSGVQILKTDANTNAPLQGAVFTIQRVNGERIGDKYTTDVSGKIIVSDLEEGVYIISEIQAPAEYILDAQPQTVEVKSGRLTLVEFTNTPYPYLHIIKTNAATGELLSGAEFTVTNSKGELIAKVTSQASGAVSIKVAPGIYTITEVKTPVGYENNDPIQTVEVRENGTSVYYGTNTAYPSNTAAFANRPLNAIEIIKLDAVTNDPLSKAVFTITKSNGDSIGSFRTDNSGSILVTGLTEGQYIIKEISAPDGYILDEIPQTINLNGGKLVPVMFLNKPLSGIQITKLDAADGKPLGGASFRVTRANGELVGTFRTEADGMAVVPNLDEGTYTVSEITAPVGYQLDNTPKNVNVVSGITATVEFTNKPYSGIQILKTDAVTNIPLANATFTVDRSNGERIGVYKTDAAGQILVPDLAEGTYIISETAAPNGYMLDQTPKTVTVVSGRVTSVEFTNLPYGSIVIKKIDEITGRPLTGAHFTVTHQGGSAVGDFITDNDGSIAVPNLEPGWYIVSETKAPNGYHLDSAAKTIEVKPHAPTSITFNNRPYSGIEIVKLDAITRQPLQGAAFTVTKADGERIGTFRTESDGKVLITGLVEGVYVVGEISAPDGYQLDESPKNVTVISGKLADVEFVNKPYSGIEIVKIDAVTKVPLQGATFTVERSDGSKIGTYKTDAAGKILVNDLLDGSYIVSEVAAPTGYMLNETPKVVNVVSGRLASVEFSNSPYGSLIIKKTDEITYRPLAGAHFTVKHQNGKAIGDFITGNDGAITIPNLEPGWYVISETKAPNGYHLDSAAKTIEVTSHAPTSITFTNRPYSGIEIIKTDAVTHAPLAGATFTVVRSNGESVGSYKTDASGKIVVSNLTEGTYVVSETIAPDGYQLDETPQTVVITSGKLTTVEFSNKPYSGIEIIKLNAITKAPLMGATFTVEYANGEKVGTYKTDAAGKIIVNNLPEGTYIVSETVAPNGFTLDEAPKTVVVKTGKLTTVEFTNKPLSGIEIIKLDAIRFTPLAGATFVVERANGEKVGTYRTDWTGKIIISSLTEGTYIVSETIAPNGYVIDEMPKTVIVTSGKLTTIEFTNRPLSGIEIIKIDAVTKAPLMGATFAVERSNGEKIGTYKTDTSGKIIVSGLSEGTYIVSETIAPDGYILSETPKTVDVTSGKLTSIEFINKPLSGIEIIKLDAQTNAPLTGATFVVERDNGEKIGTYKTDRTGKIIVNDLTEGTYIVSETAAPDGYILDEAPKTITVKSGKLTIVEFFNKPLAGLKIIKLDSVTRNPIEGVEFEVTKMNGEKIENDFRGYNFKTDKIGQIYIPRLTDGYYTVTETRTVDGYILDGEPKTVLIQSGKTTVLEVLNTPMSGLLIVKTDSITGKPLAGVVFDIKRADGSFVTGNILDGNQPNTANNSPNKTTSPNGDITGSYTTDANGRILLNGLEAGQYTVTERKSANGYELDTNVYNVTVLPGKIATLQLANKPMGGIRLTKIDSLTKKPIYNVEFMLFDSSNKVIGVYYTDNNGIIDFPKDIPSGRYTIRETRAAAGYYLDDMPKTIEFVAGQVTEITWTNTPQMGQIQILKKSGDANEINGFAAGTPLEGAVFEVYNYKTGNLVDRFVSGSDGKAVSSPLPLGRYIIKEVQAPKNYKLSDKELDITIEFATEIVKKEYLNYSANTGVSIKKTGNVEAMPGDLIRYDIKEVRNTGTVPLTDFFWRDVLPVDAVRLNKIVTGTYNQSLKYKILATTNKGNTIIIADNLSTTKNNVIDCSSASLGLKNDEFVTSFTLMFGTVKAGFAQVETPQVYVNVLKTLHNGYKFANKVDCGGKYNGEWVVGNSTTVCTIYSNTKLPKTGY